MGYKAEQNSFDAYGRSYNLNSHHDGSLRIGRDVDPYAEEYPTTFTHVENYRTNPGSYRETYDVDHHGTSNHRNFFSNDIPGGSHSQQHTFKRPHPRASFNWNNDDAGLHDYPTAQPAKIPVPSSTYLHLTEQPSLRLTDPTQTRKLLILDLNGTLLYREPRPRGIRDPYAPNEPRPLRPTHLRPYIPSFKAFLFHPATRKWLDTMVWSSAQYPNVKDMVGRCFGEEQVEQYAEQIEATQVPAEEIRNQKGGLVAIWDRKFLGLSEAQYRIKFQTTKNLEKPWALLPLSTFSGPTKILSEAWDRVANDEADIVTASSDSNSQSWLNHTSFSNSLIAETNSIRDEILTHSAVSTVLLDDSPLKARMQPYNHICVPEYEGKLYTRDVRIAETRNSYDISEKYPQLIPQPVAVEPVEASTSENSNGVKFGKRKRSRSPSPQCLPHSRKKQKGYLSTPDSNPSSHYDHILLAVIGLLDALKHESNVAAWIRSEGLFAADGTEHIDSNLPDDQETKRAVEGNDMELDNLYRNSVPEGIDSVARGAKKKNKERWRTGRESGISTKSVGSEQSWTDGSSMTIPESTDPGHGNDIGVIGDALVKDEDAEVIPSSSQRTEPASRPITPDSKDTMNYSGATTQPPSPPSARLRKELARKRHLLPRPRQEPRDVLRPSRQPLSSKLDVVDSVYLYGKDADVSSEKTRPPIDLTVHDPQIAEPDSCEKDVFSSPRASPPGLTGKALDIHSSDEPVDEFPVMPNIYANSVTFSKSDGLVHPLPSFWYQHPPARWYWVRRGVRALNELGLKVIPGVDRD